VRLVAALVVVVATRAVLPWWAVGVLAGVAVVAAVIAGMAAIEARVFDRDRGCPVVVVARRPEATPDHAAFARALTAVATAYLSACEREDRRP
jgi:hypothetical protein